MLEFHQQYGPVVRLAPGELTYTSATAAKEIYGNRGGRKLMPPQSSLGANEKTMFGATSFLWLEDHKEHARHRKIVGQMFSEASLKAQEPLVLGFAALLMERFRERASRGEVIDMWAWFNYYTFVSDHFFPSRSSHEAVLYGPLLGDHSITTHVPIINQNPGNPNFPQECSRYTY